LTPLRITVTVRDLPGCSVKCDGETIAFVPPAIVDFTVKVCELLVTLVTVRLTTAAPGSGST
jgi:hypothetical protein